MEGAMRELTQRLSVLIVAGLSALTVFAAVRGALAVVALAAGAPPGAAMVSLTANETRQTIWDGGVRPGGVDKAQR
jgi:creatinine amidohydrolase/Fe(II)-dependent formamide hydrolase-like protein